MLDFVRGQVGADLDREGRRVGPGISGDVGIALMVHGDAGAKIKLRTANIAGVDEATAVDLDLRHVGVIGAAVVGQIRSVLHREGGFGRVGAAGDVGVAGAVQGNVQTGFRAHTSDVT